MRAAIADGHAEALGRSDGDVGAHGARLFQEGQREGIGGDDADGVRLMQGGDLGGEVADPAIGAGELEDAA